ncbi:MAG: DUF3467 domain-containing protein [Chloroflexi bacterium]|nr:DUF3467 domain-containing protein [Chloroflexota bacterium]
MTVASAASLTIRHSADEPRTYANLCGVLVGPEEAILQFAVRDLADPAIGQGVATIYTSVYHLKRLAVALFTAIEQHERRFGRVETDVKKRLTSEARDETMRLGNEP